jgi:hypothetical protein
MRRVLVDAARARLADKRGGGMVRVTFDEEIAGGQDPAGELVTLDAALEALAALDHRKGRVVELRFFGGLSLEETAVPERGVASARRAAASDSGGYVNSRAADERKPRQLLPIVRSGVSR